MSDTSAGQAREFRRMDGRGYQPPSIPADRDPRRIQPITKTSGETNAMSMRETILKAMSASGKNLSCAEIADLVGEEKNKVSAHLCHLANKKSIVKIEGGPVLMYSIPEAVEASEPDAVPVPADDQTHDAAGNILTNDQLIQMIGDRLSAPAGIQPLAVDDERVQTVRKLAAFFSEDIAANLESLINHVTGKAA